MSLKNQDTDLNHTTSQALLYCTTNEVKFKLAESICKKHDIKLKQHHVEVDEIQSDDPKAILEHKVGAIYEKIGQPLLVSDDSWDIPALNGFPGPYMKQINGWFTPQDWINLMSGHQDKTIFLISRVAYIQNGEITYFEGRSESHFLDTPSQKDGISILRAIRGLNSPKPLNEIWLETPEKIFHGTEHWGDFAKWYTSQTNTT